MTQLQAIREARRRWSSRAFCYKDGFYKVGFCDGFRDIVLGCGQSWKEALDQAPSDVLTNDQMIALPAGDRSEFARLHGLEELGL